MKRNTEAQRMNLQQNSSFVNRTQFPLLCVKYGAILLVLVGLTAGWQSDEIILQFSNLSTDRFVRFFMEFNEGTVLL